jgi:predicted DNA-binding protein
MRHKTDHDTLVARLPLAMGEALDELAKHQFRTRSDVVRQALLAELEKNGLVPIADARAA